MGKPPLTVDMPMYGSTIILSVHPKKKSLKEHQFFFKLIFHNVVRAVPSDSLGLTQLSDRFNI